MSIHFTQYLRPDGRPKSVHINRPQEIETKAKQIFKAGFSFECEHLSTGDVSLTIVNKAKEEDVAIEIVPNGPDVPKAVDKLIMEFEL